MAADDVLTFADKAWRGEIELTPDHHPVSPANVGELAEVTDGAAFTPSFANVTSIATGDGLVLVDTGSVFYAKSVHEQVRRWSAERLHTAVYSHGHIDHVFGVPVWEEESDAKGWPRPTVVAHEAMPKRFDRYVMTAGYNGVINARQFGLERMRWPTDYRYPDQTYRDRLNLRVGDTDFELHHCRGETDDHTWTWVPSKRVLCTGDLFIWASPNGGNPQKVQRYARDWAQGLRTMATLDAEYLLPGHGIPVVGADRVRQALGDTAELLEWLHDQTVALMNEGATLDDIVHTVRGPAALMAKPYLRPIYDEPEFIVRNVWRLYGGWYDGNPARLKPARDAALAVELAALVGGAGQLAARARELATADDEDSLRLACHLAEWATQAAPDDKAVHEARRDVYQRRLTIETSTMATGVYSWAVRESTKQAEA